MIKEPGHKIILTAIFLTLGVYFTMVIWIWKSESLFRINVYDLFLLLTAFLITGIIAVVYSRYRKNGGKYGPVVFGTILFAVWLFLIVPVGSLAYLATSPAYFDYSITTGGLDRYEGGLTTDIIVPLPVKDGIPVIPEKAIQYRRFGNWTSLLVVTPQGKMIAFQTGDRDLTDINAHFFVPLEGPALFSRASPEMLQPAIDQGAGDRATRADDSGVTTVFSSQVYLDENIRPVINRSPPVRIDLDMVYSEGMSFGRYGEYYHARTGEEIAGGSTGWIPVRVQLTMDRGPAQVTGQLNDGIPFSEIAPAGKKPCKSNEEWHRKADEIGFWNGGILVSESMTDDEVFSLVTRYNISTRETIRITGPHFLGYYLTVNETQNQSLVNNIKKSPSGWNVSFSSPMYAFFPPGIKARDNRIEIPVFLSYTERMNETMVFDNLVSRDIPLRKARIARLGYFPSLDPAGKEKILQELNADPRVLFAFKEYLEGDIC
ncbi:MAG: hypothetical protein WC379_06350 [Methanoregula sp.]